MAFIDLIAELSGDIDGLPQALAKKHLNRAWRDVRECGRQWGFQFGTVGIPLPQAISGGTVSVTQYSTSVTPDGTAAPLLNGVVAGTPPLVMRQFRAVGGPLYTIASWTAPAGPLVLDRPFEDASNAAATYQVYQAYYPAPFADNDFVRWITVVDPNNEYGLELDHTQQELAYYDPGRQSVNQPYWVASYQIGSVKDSTGAVTLANAPFFELWPHPTVAGSLVAQYQRRGADLVLPTDTFPGGISDELVMARAKGWYAYPWAMANVGRFPSLKGVNWGLLITDAKRSYLGDRATNEPGLLQQTKRTDDEAFPRGIIFKRPRRRSGWPGPIDAAFFQTHGVPSGF